MFDHFPLQLDDDLTGDHLKTNESFCYLKL